MSTILFNGYEISINFQFVELKRIKCLLVTLFNFLKKKRNSQHCFFRNGLTKVGLCKIFSSSAVKEKDEKIDIKPNISAVLNSGMTFETQWGIP